MWKILSFLDDEDSDSVLAGEMKGSIKENLGQRYDDGELQLLLNTATHLDPRFKDSFVARG